jgi:hypothetical protein
MINVVTLQLAKLIKEKGIDTGYELGYYSDTNNSYKITAPAISGMVMWLYRNHKIWISVKQIQQKDTFTWEIVQSNEEKWHSIDWSGEEINSPEEAYESAIEWILKELL